MLHTRKILLTLAAMSGLMCCADRALAQFSMNPTFSNPSGKQTMTQVPVQALMPVIVQPQLTPQQQQQMQQILMLQALQMRGSRGIQTGMPQAMPYGGMPIGIDPAMQGMPYYDETSSFEAPAPGMDRAAKMKLQEERKAAEKEAAKAKKEKADAKKAAKDEAAAEGKGGKAADKKKAAEKKPADKQPAAEKKPAADKNASAAKPANKK